MFLFVKILPYSEFKNRLLYKDGKVLALTDEEEVTVSATIADMPITATPTPSPTPSTSITITPTPSPTPSISTTITPTPSIRVTLTPTPSLVLTPVPKTPEPPSKDVVNRYFSLFGYTSAYATVKLEGIGLLEQTQANSKGYFEFNNSFAPEKAKEFCLTGIDTEKLSSLPLCITPPVNTFNRKYGPYLLPPTIRLGKGSIEVGETGIVSGKTIPGTDVNVNVFDEPEGGNFALRIVKAVYANNRPKEIKLTARSDGSYTAPIYSDTGGKKRVFAQGVYSQQKTPKSITLTLSILSWLMIVLEMLIKFLSSLFTLNNIIIAQLLLLFLYILYRRKKLSWFAMHKEKQRAIVLYNSINNPNVQLNYCPIDSLVKI
jgi:hypothetical protein